jgi:hypothetical protein
MIIDNDLSEPDSGQYVAYSLFFSDTPRIALRVNPDSYEGVAWRQSERF